MNILTLSLAEARLLALNSQGLLSKNPGKGKKATLNIIEQLGYVQIDTLAVVARAHHHTLWSRLPDYQEKYLAGLQEKDKKIFEYWSHAASYLPMRDYRFSLPLKKAYAEGKSHWFDQDHKLKQYVLDRIKAEGPLQSKDFEHKSHKAGSWFEWKPAKKALEQLFMEGALMVARRSGFQKVYDLTENVLPKGIDTNCPDSDEYAEHLILSAVQAHGIVSAAEICYLRNRLKPHINKALKMLVRENRLREVLLAGAGNTVFITTDNHLNNLERIRDEETIHFLSPFDNVVIQRSRLKKLFGFDYQIECYVPEAKRKYGYFTLPVLYGNRFVARFDPKADRAEKTFRVKALHFENDFKPDDSFNLLFAGKLGQFAAFNGCERIVIEQADKIWKTSVNKKLKAAGFI